MLLNLTPSLSDMLSVNHKHRWQTGRLKAATLNLSTCISHLDSL